MAIRCCAVVALLLAWSVTVVAVRGVGASSSVNWDVVDQVLQEGIANKVFPGCVAAVITPGGPTYLRAFGSFTYGLPAPHSGNNPAMTTDTLFDLASLTKVVATTSAAALLYQQGLLPLDTLVADASLLGPAFANNGKEDIKVRNLLLHNAGLPPDPSPNYWEAGFGCPATAQWHPELTFSCSEQIFNGVLTQTLAHAVGKKYVYSDLSMITMQYIVGTLAQAHGLVHTSDLLPACDSSNDGLRKSCYYEAFVRTKVLQPLGMTASTFLPPPSTAATIAPTWNDTQYRHRVLQGVVSDGNSYALGGIAGHAGLFATASDLLKLEEALLRPQQGGGGFLSAAVVGTFTRVANTSQSSRALGWNTNDYQLNTYRGCGDLSAATFTHTGFTGTQLCMDPVRGVGTVLLTARVYPEKFAQMSTVHAVRKAFNNAVKAVVTQCASDCGTVLCSCTPKDDSGSSGSQGVLDGARDRAENASVLSIALACLLLLLCVATACFWKRGAFSFFKQRLASDSAMFLPPEGTHPDGSPHGARSTSLEMRGLRVQQPSGARRRASSTSASTDDAWDVSLTTHSSGGGGVGAVPVSMRQVTATGVPIASPSPQYAAPSASRRSGGASPGPQAHAQAQQAPQLQQQQHIGSSPSKVRGVGIGEVDMRVGFEPAASTRAYTQMSDAR